MKLNAIQRYSFSGMLYDWEQEVNSEERSYFPFGRVSFEYMNDPDSPRIVVKSKNPMKRFMLLTDIRDGRGNLVMGDGQYLITTIKANINSFGTLEGYIHTAAMTRDPNFDDLYGAGIEGGVSG